MICRNCYSGFKVLKNPAPDQLTMTRRHATCRLLVLSKWVLFTYNLKKRTCIEKYSQKRECKAYSSQCLINSQLSMSQYKNLPNIKCTRDDQIKVPVCVYLTPMLFERLEFYKWLDHRRIKMLFIFDTVLCTEKKSIPPTFCRLTQIGVGWFNTCKWIWLECIAAYKMHCISTE